MKQYLFEERNQAVWQNLEAILDELEKTRKKRIDNKRTREFSNYYRQTCYHYSIAKTRHYSPHLTARLHDLVLRAHQQLYSSKQFVAWNIVQFIVVDFPVTVRTNANFLYLSLTLFYLPAFIMGILCFYDPDFIYTLLSESQVFSFESMYSPNAETIGRTRESATDFYMFGHYIQNNIGIGFRTFAGGILLGIGTVLSLLFNGVFIGAVAGYLSQLGYVETFWTFVSGHSAFELTAICVCGAAGLRIAYPLFAPGNYTRMRALRMAARQAVVLVMGAAIMLLAAAFIEAFWSSNRAFAPMLKYIVGIVFWVLVLGYFIFAGRRSYAN